MKMVIIYLTPGPTVDLFNTSFTHTVFPSKFISALYKYNIIVSYSLI